MAEQGNTTNPDPQEQENTQQQPAKEPWWKDHVRQLVVSSGRTPPPPPGPPAWALQQMQPAPLPPPPLPQVPPHTTEADPTTAAAIAPVELPADAPPATEPAEQKEQAEEAAPLPEPELKGYTNALPIASILEFLSVNRQSGTLYLTNTEETFSLEILDGDIVHASSDRSGDDQLLGSILVARDKIGTEQLEEFYKRFSPNADPNEPGDYEELVSREDLKLAVEAQVQELFNRLYAADDCSFCFYEGETSGVEQRIRLNVTRLLLESARTLDELERSDPVEAEAVETPEAEETQELGLLDQIDEGEAQECSEVEEEQDASDGEPESFDEAGDFDDTVPFDGAPDYGPTEPIEEMQPLDDTPPFDDSTPFDHPVPLDDTPRFDSEDLADLTDPEGPTQLGDSTEFKEFEGSVEMGDEFDELVESDQMDEEMANELDPADQRDRA